MPVFCCCCCCCCCFSLLLFFFCFVFLGGEEKERDSLTAERGVTELRSLIFMQVVSFLSGLCLHNRTDVLAYVYVTSRKLTHDGDRKSQTLCAASLMPCDKRFAGRVKGSPIMTHCYPHTSKTVRRRSSGLESWGRQYSRWLLLCGRCSLWKPELVTTRAAQGANDGCKL